MKITSVILMSLLTMGITLGCERDIVAGQISFAFPAHCRTNAFTVESIGLNARVWVSEDGQCSITSLFARYLEVGTIAALQCPGCQAWIVTIDGWRPFDMGGGVPIGPPVDALHAADFAEGVFLVLIR